MFSECNPAKASGVSLLAVLATAKLTAGFSTHLKYSLDHSNLSFKAWGIFACHFANSLHNASYIWLELGAVSTTSSCAAVSPLTSDIYFPIFFSKFSEQHHG